MTSKQFSLKRALLLITFGLLFGGLTLELGLRLMGQKKSKVTFLRKGIDHALQYDTATFYMNVPYCIYQARTPEYHTVYRINSLGFRDREISLTKKKGVFRILFIGDSFTFGTGIDQDKTWIRQLEHLLNNDSEIRSHHVVIETINAGVGGYNTEHELLAYKKWVPILKPDLVVLTFLPNDIIHNYHGIDSWYNFDKKGKLIRGKWGQQILHHPKKPVHQRVSIIAKIKHLIIAVIQQLKLGELLLNKITYIRQFYFGHFYHVGEVYQKRPSLEATHGWEATAAIFQRFRQAEQQYHVPLIVNAVPQRIQVLLKRNAKKFPAYRYNKPERRLASILKPLHIPYFLFIEHVPDDSPDLHYLKDGHLNPRGVKMLATALYPFMRKQVINILNAQSRHSVP